VIDRSRLIELSGAADDAQLRTMHREWIEVSMQPGRNFHEPAWSEAAAVGSFEFVEMIRHRLGLSPSAKRTGQSGDIHLLKEPKPKSPYMPDLQGKNMLLSDDNSVNYDENVVVSIS